MPSVPSIKATFDFFFKNIDRIDTNNSGGVEKEELKTWLGKNSNPAVDILILKNFGFFDPNGDQKITSAEIVEYTSLAPDDLETNETNVSNYLNPLIQSAKDRAKVERNRYSQSLESLTGSEQQKEDAISQEGGTFVLQNIKKFKLEKPKQIKRKFEGVEETVWVQKGTYQHPKTKKETALSIDYSQGGTSVTLFNYDKDRQIETTFGYGRGFRGALEIVTNLKNSEEWILGQSEIQAMRGGDESKQVHQFIKDTKGLRKQFKIPQMTDKEGNDLFPKD
jgi:hypothetical protein